MTFGFITIIFKASVSPGKGSVSSSIKLDSCVIILLTMRLMIFLRSSRSCTELKTLGKVGSKGQIFK